MKVRTGICIVMLAAAAWAQAPQTNPAPASKATGKAPAAQAPAAKPAAQPATKATTPTTPKPLPRMVSPMAPRTSQAPVKAEAPKTVKPLPMMRPKATAAKAEPAKAPMPTPVAAKPKGKRDPFTSPIVGPSQGPDMACSTGKKCLVIDQIVLKGVIKSQGGMIAVVENPAKKAYFLRENDPVFNGNVVRITGDSVVFRENTVDKLGKPQSRDIVKKVTAPVV